MLEAQSEWVGTILEQCTPTATCKLGSWQSSSPAVKVHLGDTGLKTHGVVPEIEGASPNCYQDLSNYEAKCARSLLLGHRPPCGIKEPAVLWL